MYKKQPVSEQSNTLINIEQSINYETNTHFEEWGNHFNLYLIHI